MRNALQITLFAARPNLTSRIFKTAAAFLAALTLAAPARAGTILVDQSDPYLGYFFGGSFWTSFTAYLAAEPGGYTIGSIANSGEVSAASSVLVVLRQTTDVLSAGEQTNLSSALSAGKHVVLLGENDSWAHWDNSILDFAGGDSIFSTSILTTVTPVVSIPLTAGITYLSLYEAGVAHPASGGIPLFTENWATLWGPNLLTALDVDVLGNPGNQSGIIGNTHWQQNVADYLGPPAVPLPATLPLFATSLGLMGWFAWRKKRKAA